MKFNAPTYDLPAEGLHNAVCTRIIDLGTQTGSYQGKITSAKKVMLGFELAEQRPDGSNFTVAKIYTASLHIKSNLRRDVESWRGQSMSNADVASFDPLWLAGRPCRILVKHGISSESERAYIEQILPPLASGASPRTTLEVLTFDLGEPDQEVFLALSPGVRRMIENSPEWRVSSLGSATAANDVFQVAKALM
jgi:hypothetical protein